MVIMANSPTIETIVEEGVEIANWPLPNTIKLSEIETVLQDYSIHHSWSVAHLTIAAPNVGLVGTYSIDPQSDPREYILLQLSRLDDKTSKRLNSDIYP